MPLDFWYAIGAHSIQNWEQARRVPEGPARTLLAVIARNPKTVERALLAAAG
jgi:putative transcriptional regulator